MTSAVHDIALVTCAWPRSEVLRAEDALLETELRRRGLKAATVAWERSGRARASTYVVRTAYNWCHRWADFREFVASASEHGRVYPSLSAVDRIHHKRYLLALERAHIPIVPTEWVERGADIAFADVVARIDAERVVLKPAVSVGAHNLHVFERANARELGATLSKLAQRFDVMVQPFLESVRTEGELSIVWMDGRVAYAVHRVPAEGDFRAHPVHGSIDRVVPVPRDAAETAERVIDLVAAGTLAGRVDFLRSGGAWVVSEVEAIAPLLFFAAQASGVASMADAVCRAHEATEEKETAP